MAWAFATVNYLDEKLSAALAIAAGRRLSKFNLQNVANTAWAFATVNCWDEKPFAALAKVAERRLSELTPQDVANTAWAFTTVNYRDEKLLAAENLEAISLNMHGLVPPEHKKISARAGPPAPPYSRDDE